MIKVVETIKDKIEKIEYKIDKENIKKKYYQNLISKYKGNKSKYKY